MSKPLSRLAVAAATGKAAQKMLHLCSRKRDSGRKKVEVQTEYTICIFKQQRHSRRRIKARHSDQLLSDSGRRKLVQGTRCRWATASSGSRIPFLAIYLVRESMNSVLSAESKNSAPLAVGGVQVPASAAQT